MSERAPEPPAVAVPESPAANTIDPTWNVDDELRKAAAPKAADETLRRDYIAEMEFHFGPEGSGCHVAPEHVRALLAERDALKAAAEWDADVIIGLISERAALSADLEKVQTELDVAEAECTALRATSEEQESRLMELLDRCQRSEHAAQEEKARLDWLDRVKPSAMGFNDVSLFCDAEKSTATVRERSYRAAIDAARLASTETEL